MQGPDKKANIYLSAQQAELVIHLLSERQDLRFIVEFRQTL